MMGNQPSSPSEHIGKVDGRPVSFTYAENDGVRELAWREIETEAKGKIANQDIISALPVHAHLPNDYTVLYVKPNPAAKDKDALRTSPVVFCSLVLTKPPLAFVHDHQPPGEACWQLRQDNGQPPNLHIVVSTGSGMGQAESVWELLVKPMLHHICPTVHNYSLHVTTSEWTVTDLTRDVFLAQANQRVSQAIILLSGDGGLVDVVNGLYLKDHTRTYVKPNIALLPLGTGNAMAHSSGITKDNTLGLRNLLQGHTKELPLFRASFSPAARQLVNEGRDERELQIMNGTPIVHGAVVCSWGLHATLVADSDTYEYRKFGAERFQMAAKEALFPADGSPPHAYRGKVSVLRPSTGRSPMWQPLDSEEHAYVLATFVSHLEKGFTISPAAKPLDGKLRLVYFSTMSGQDAMELMTKAYQGGKHVEDTKLQYEDIDGLRIDFDEDDARWRRVCVDGKIIRIERGGWMEVRAGVQPCADLIVMG
ncbi:hypothetical protein BAUCODRAFT_37776 [Baudoinia panamericana UAMH 10762]|uniref:DAGKc domain-containing protein n=1 Tax=Baudoinia panamericana (strain UAMH 10762) TaxID=717646 RepID=M2M8X7_BAUPA|nr:uncharacterized protein BAUCODRAFT_37776 [Baudoinia panamericana UAMH 10762]EMC92861.1 hypothetical protein BAUCODRAFT_37776 [Baudoinia panamericana UAMH 10762]